MSTLTEAAKRRQQLQQSLKSDMGTSQTQATTGVGVDSPTGYKSLRNEITSIDDVQSKAVSNSISDLLKKRAEARVKIAKGEISSGNEAADYLEMRKGGLVDVFSDFMMQNKNIVKDDASAQLLEKKIKESPDDIIDYMKYYVKTMSPEDADAKTQAIDDYIMKGGKLNDVMDYISGISSNQYGIQEPEKLKDTNPFLNFLGSIVATPVKEVSGLVNIIGEKTGLEEKEKASALGAYNVEGVTTKSYEQYKATGKLPEKYPEDHRYLYDSYDDAVNNGFVGSIEEYNNYIGAVAEASYKTQNQKVNDWLESHLYNPEESGALLGNMMGDVIEMTAAELLTAGAATPELAATKLPKYAKYLSWAADAIKGGVEFQALEDAYEGQLSDVPDYMKSVMTNSLVKGGIGALSSAYKWATKKGAEGLAKLSGIKERGMEAVEGETLSSTNHKIEVIKESMKSNPQNTPEKEIAGRFKALREKIAEDVKNLRGNKTELERGFKSEQSPDTLVDNLNNTFKKLKDPDIMGEQVWAEIPEIKIGESELSKLTRKEEERGVKKAIESTKKALDKSTEELKAKRAALTNAKKGKNSDRIAKAQKEYDEALQIQEKASNEYEAAAKRGGIVTEKATKAAEDEGKRLSKLSEEERTDILRKRGLEAEKAEKEAAKEERRRKYEMTIENEDLLKSGYSQDKIKLIDIIKEEWNKMFVKGGKEFNASNLYDLTKLIESKSGGTEGTKEVVTALKDTMDGLLASLGKDYQGVSNELWSKSDILEGIDDVLGRLTKRTSEAGTEMAMQEAGSKAFKKDLRELLTQAKNYYKDFDLNTEIDSWIVYMSAFNPEAAQKIIKDIYPSLPGLMEALINGGKLRATRTFLKTAQKAGEKATGKSTSNIRDAIGRSVRGKTSEGIADYMSD